MERYQLTIGLKPDLSAPKKKKILSDARKLIKDAQGVPGEVKTQGLVKLAYPIEKFSEADFLTVPFEIEGEKISGLQKELGLLEGVLRMMIIRGEVKGKS
jgi:ribosomal protein S6